MAKEILIQFEKGIDVPKNDPGGDIQRADGFALVGKDLWDLEKMEMIPGQWQAINELGTIALKLTDDQDGPFLEVCSIPDGKIITKFEMPRENVMYFSRIVTKRKTQVHGESS